MPSGPTTTGSQGREETRGASPVDVAAPGISASNTIKYWPILARTATINRPVGPVAFDCVQLSFVRAGSASVFSEFGRRRAREGDAVLLAPNTLWGSEPDDWATVTTVYVDNDFLVDQVFWKHAPELTDRLHTQELLAERYVDAVQVLRLGRHRLGKATPALDGLVAISAEGRTQERFYRVLSLFFSVLDLVTPFISISDDEAAHARPVPLRPTLPRHRLFHPLRDEALRARELLREGLSEKWTLATLSERVHLSESQLGRVFVASFGKTPLAYLTMLRVEEMACLLRTTSAPIGSAAQQVGWSDPSYAARVFKSCVGITPRAYRTMCRERNDIRVE